MAAIYIVATFRNEKRGRKNGCNPHPHYVSKITKGRGRKAQRCVKLTATYQHPHRNSRKNLYFVPFQSGFQQLYATMKRLHFLSLRASSHFFLPQILMLFSLLSLFSCNGSRGGIEEEEPGSDSLAIREAYANSPIVSAEDAIGLMKVENGFKVQLVAAEPTVNSPVLVSFDEKGRMWVVEMEGYMPDIEGKGEETRSGKIVILEDDDHDGKADKRRVFLDSLVLPRAICFIENGLLVAEPPNLWYVKMENDVAGKKVLVDPEYTEGGNVEHQPNALFRALDNWIYNAEGRKRYKKKGDKWLIENMQQRGQWGLSQDDQGRLFYNNNSQNLLGDFFPPHFGIGNSHQRRAEGFNKNIVNDNRVYPIRPTPGVNRGYMKGVLDDSLRLVNFTAASGPVLYRGDLFGKEYYNNAFVPEPSANLIKRNILEERGFEVHGKQAYKGKEFLASTDERFRPVIACNGPDGALYFVDMYRGVIQHKTYLTDYLKKEIKSRELEKPINLGRIYKVIPENKNPQPVLLNVPPVQLVNFLSHPNGWIRDKAQQLLVDAKSPETVAPLRKLVQQRDHQQAFTHALWTLEGMGTLQATDVLPALQDQAAQVKMQGLSVLPSVMNKSNYKDFLPVLQKLVITKDTLIAPYIGFVVKTVNAFDKKAADQLTFGLVKNYPKNVYVADALITSLQDRESTFLKELKAAVADTTVVLYTRLERLVADIRNAGSNRNPRTLEREYPKGAALFRSICQTCHGADGNGIKSLAPPLNNSNWVKGDKNKLIPIILYGLTGPVKVNETVYGPPEINGDMPGIGNNKEFTDQDLSQLLSFIRKSWRNDAPEINAADIKKVRDKYKGRQKAFTATELNRIK
jgi:mono/diheme cytochrome c family protein/glucose/arabinose dehydrogenase